MTALNNKGCYHFFSRVSALLLFVKHFYENDHYFGAVFLSAQVIII